MSIAPLHTTLKTHEFLEILNEAAASFPAIWESAGERRGESEAMEAWAGFLSDCVRRGVSMGDPRWRDLEVRGGKDGRRFVLPRARGGRLSPEPDFGVGLALLMGLLDRDTGAR